MFQRALDIFRGPKRVRKKQLKMYSMVNRLDYILKENITEMNRNIKIFCLFLLGAMRGLLL
jgi:hypothetical protein